MLSAVGAALTEIISWIGTVVSALLTDAGALHELLPLFAIGVAASCFFFAIKALKSLCWGA